MKEIESNQQNLKNVSFGIYHPSEIKKLSVIEIINPETHEKPLPYGLYDPHLGPIDETTCETCGLSGKFCPGHFGHITLPLPVFNPVLLKSLYQLLQATCFNCHKLLADALDVHLLLCQLEALDYGQVSLAIKFSKIPKQFKFEKRRKSLDDFNRDLEHVMDEAIPGLNLLYESRGQIKSVVECRQQVINDFWNILTKNGKKKCLHCDKTNLKIAKNAEDICTKRHFIFYETERNENSSFNSMDSLSEDTVNVNLTPLDLRLHLNEVWENESTVLEHLFGCLSPTWTSSDYPMDVFFIGMLMVPPSRFRPAVIIEDQTFLNPQSLTLKNVVHDVAFLKHLQDSLNGKPIADTIKKKFYSIPGKTNGDKFNNMWHQLQTHVNFVYSGETITFSKEVTAKGIKQMLEKKEGLIQEHMMGKRVNFAARTVITPNPYIGVDEIGVPEMFAKTLTYRTSVTNFNALKLKAAVINGADFHPGANKIEKDGGKVINLGSMDPYVRRTNAHWLSKNYSSQSTCKKNPIKIHRHLKDGDVVLLNRQPTLHKPSIMAHKVKVLPGAGKTFQLHYANCKAYNADFDGDEMNLHFPQSECGRSEASNILNVSNQYLVPKDGTPLSGLIQDHIVAGVLLSMRGRFFTRDEYQQLVYDAVAFLKKPIKTLPPAILKPCALWSGKQVISTIIIIVTPDGLPPPTLDGKAHISSKNWQKVAAREWRAGGTPLLSDDMSESQVIIRSGELLCGVIDKAHVGPTPYGLVHCCYELYGGVISTALLTSLTRLFTNFLQTHSGFTLSIDDICLTKKANKSRRKVMNSTHKNVKDVVADVFGVDNPENESEVKARFKEAHMTEDDVVLKALHFRMKRAVNIYNDQKNGICMSEPMKKFPDNNFQLMVQAGSKGSVVNALQISSGLGQVELEGQRVPLMLNGNTLPSYLPYSTSFEAGGFVDGRFLTGLYPQEFFFHCLAGREGLVDTAVKTSGSGHLYNSLVKHLEGLMVNYDLTVRDADGSVIQFLYGEDGLDVTKVQMLQKDKLHFLAKNYVAAKNETEIKILKARQAQPSFLEEVKAINRSLEPDINLQNENTVYQGIMSSVLGNDLCNLCFYVKESEQKANLDRGNFRLRPDLIFGYVSKQVAKIIEDYINTNYIKKMGPGDQNMETFTAAVNLLSLYYHRALRAVAPPGEAVGLLAAQSIGEPATQMTLNTFHFAGRNEMNVTLGMPRLREILMYASENIKTPIMDLPLLEKSGVEKEAEKLCLKLSKVYLKQVLRSIEIQESLHVEVRSQSFRKYTVKMTFLPVDEYKDILFTTPACILKFVESYFIEHVIKISKNSILDKTRKYSPKKSAAIEHSDVEEFDESVSDDDGVDCAAPMEAHGKMGKGFSKDVSTPNKFAFKDDQLREAVERRKSRENSVVNKDSWIKTYEFDARYQRWCKFELQIPLEEKKIDIKTIIEDEANNAVLHEVPNVEKAFLVENAKSKKKEKMLKTDGINIHEVFRHHHIIDVNKIYSNDIHAMKNIYGIEAATKVIVKEVANVFATYGIRVDPRHLLLIADYMTCEGTVKAFNHYGFQTNASPLQKMSFATAMDFLENAIVSVMITFVAGRKETQKDPQHFENHCSLFQANDREGEKEDLKSPSAKIIVGQPVTIGTGCFELLQKPEAARSTKARSGKIKFLL